MKLLLKRQLPLLFFIATLAYILAGEFQLKPLQLATKPLLMPLLMIWLGMHVSSNNQRNLILAALAFSCAGDVFLLLEYKNKMLFIPGLVSFLTTHILYIIYFLKRPGNARSLLSTAPYFALVVAAYGVALVMLLYPT
ncbi:MAG: hypothetical protein EOO03_10465 [Chitinophagaceae bacterium]|nr:MAG: hypothetical protein EOO03_10465 [Chitinophagaceae bacterium]